MSPERKHAGPPNTRFSLIDHVTETGSTNRDLLIQAERGRAEGAALMTDHQTAGRGRAGRAWSDEPGRAMLASWLVRPSPDRAGLLPLLTGLAVLRALETHGVNEPALKWPNDVLVPSHDERKLAGILAEATSTPEFAVVIGCGLNLAFGEHPPEGAHAVDVQSILASRHPVPVPLDMFRSLLAAFDALYTQFSRADDRWLADYRACCVTLGREVSMHTAAGEVIAGRAIDIDPTGALVIEMDGGVQKTVNAGDVHHVRPTDEAERER